MDNKNKQEENIGTFFDISEKKKEKSAKTRRIISRIIRLIIPPIFPFLFAYTGRIVIFLIPQLKDEFGILATILLALVLVPIYCIVYGSNVAKNEKRKYLFAMYNPVVSCWYYFLYGFFDGFFDGFFLIIVLTCGWLAFWTLVPIWKYNYNRNPDN